MRNKMIFVAHHNQRIVHIVDCSYASWPISTRGFCTWLNHVLLSEFQHFYVSKCFENITSALLTSESKFSTNFYTSLHLIYCKKSFCKWCNVNLRPTTESEKFLFDVHHFAEAWFTILSKRNAERGILSTPAIQNRAFCRKSITNLNKLKGFFSAWESGWISATQTDISH